MPADGPFTSPFGYRRDPLDGTTRFHSGLDIGASYGSTVVAAAYGTVEVVGNDSSYGNYVKINHGNGYQTVYAHNSQILVTVGQVVDKGQPIALVGATGRVTGPHCHFEIIENGVFVDPKPFIT
ncbi:MAG: M23 family metallopeptidase [Clostridiales bacterium]|nr:M23 family metallopeptidase [Clostridiales bacterium]